MRLDCLTLKAQPALARVASGLMMAFTFSTPALAQVVRISAQVDKTELELGRQLTLTITIEGDFQTVELQPFEFPEAFQVVAQRRASNVAVELGHVQRSVSLVYVLVPQAPGKFQLGPFQIAHQGKAILTDPIEIVVNKPLLPPGLEESYRYTL